MTAAHRPTTNGNADIGLHKCWRIIDPISHHGDGATTRLKVAHLLSFVARQDLAQRSMRATNAVIFNLLATKDEQVLLWCNESGSPQVPKLASLAVEQDLARSWMNLEHHFLQESTRKLTHINISCVLLAAKASTG